MGVGEVLNAVAGLALAGFAIWWAVRRHIDRGRDRDRAAKLALSVAAAGFVFEASPESDNRVRASKKLPETSRRGQRDRAIDGVGVSVLRWWGGPDEHSKMSQWRTVAVFTPSWVPPSLYLQVAGAGTTPSLGRFAVSATDPLGAADLCNGPLREPLAALSDTAVLEVRTGSVFLVDEDSPELYLQTALVAQSLAKAWPTRTPVSHTLAARPAAVPAAVGGYGHDDDWPEASPSGWFPDPGGSTQLRWWDGYRWGDELR